MGIDALVCPAERKLGSLLPPSPRYVVMWSGTSRAKMNLCARYCTHQDGSHVQKTGGYTSETWLMNSPVKISDRNVDRLIGLFQELLATLPPGAATLNSKRTERDDGTIVWLKPAREKAAEFTAHVEDGNRSLIDLTFGTGTTFELPLESRLPHDATFDMMLEAVREMGLATIAGRCGEYFGFIGIRGTIEVSEGNVLRSSRFFYPRVIPKLVRYEPYV